MYGIGSWFASWDQFGSWAKFNYRGEGGFGTAAGGCCSLIVTVLTAFLITMQLYCFLFNASFNQATTELYYTGDNEGYDVGPGDFLPSFTIITHDDSAHEDANDLDHADFNDKDLFKFYYQQITKSDDGKTATAVNYDAISCETYIDGPYWDSFTTAEKTDIKMQL